MKGLILIQRDRAPHARSQWQLSVSERSKTKAWIYEATQKQMCCHATCLREQRNTLSLNRTSAWYPFMATIFLTAASMQGADIAVFPRIINMGQLHSGDIITNSVSLVNNGVKEHVVSVAGNCSCLILPQECFLPSGATLAIPLIFNSDGKLGLFQETIHFVWDGRSTHIELTAFVKPRALLMPISINAGIIPFGNTVYTNVILRIFGGNLSDYEPLQLKTTPGLIAKLLPTSDERTASIHLTVPSQIFELGAWTNQLALEITSREGMQLATLVLSGDTERPFTIHPRVLQFGTRRSAELQLCLSDKYRQAVLYRVEDPRGNLMADIVSSYMGHWLIRISITDRFKALEDSRAILSVFTNLPRQPVWRVPILVSLGGNDAG